MADQIKVGEPVQLRGGGPIMTVISLKPEDGSAICTWFDGAGKRDNGSFPLAALKILADW